MSEPLGAFRCTHYPPPFTAPMVDPASRDTVAHRFELAVTMHSHVLTALGHMPSVDAMCERIDEHMRKLGPTPDLRQWGIHVTGPQLAAHFWQTFTALLPDAAVIEDVAVTVDSNRVYTFTPTRSPS